MRRGAPDADSGGGEHLPDRPGVVGPLAPRPGRARCRFVLLGRAAPSAAGPAWRHPADALAAMTGLPAWCAAAIALSLWSLSVALVGFSWDVAWHADLGRDKELFTPPHDDPRRSRRDRAVRADLDRHGHGRPRPRRPARRQAAPPWSSLPMGLMGAGALIGFPLDDYWHSVYGIDVTMWSPTHLLMIGGASLTPIAAWLMLAEAGPAAARGAARACSRRLSRPRRSSACRRSSWSSTSASRSGRRCTTRPWSRWRWAWAWWRRVRRWAAAVRCVPPPGSW